MKFIKLNLKKQDLIIMIAAMLCIAVFVMFYSESFKNLSWNNIFELSNTLSDKAPYDDYLKIMDVGQGDSILISSNGFSALFDMGPIDNSNDICLDLEKQGIKDIDAMVITHLHMDHVGGLDKIIENHSIRNLIIPDLLNNAEGLPAAEEARQAVVNSNGGVYTATSGMNLNIGEFEITVLAYYNNLSDENNRSIIAMAEIDDIKFLLMGDAEREAENAMLEDRINIDCDVLKVAHHGSNTSSQSKFIKKASPEYAVISVGKDNNYSHPHKDTTETLKQSGVKTFRTDRDGDVTFYVDNGIMTVVTEKGQTE